VPPSAGEVAGVSGNARFHLENYAVPDFTEFFNAISPSPKDVKPAIATFDVRWEGGGDRVTVRDENYSFVADYMASEATISFSVTTAGVTYTSVAAGQETAHSAVGRERNGVYFT